MKFIQFTLALFVTFSNVPAFALRASLHPPPHLLNPNHDTHIDFALPILPSHQTDVRNGSLSVLLGAHKHLEQQLIKRSSASLNSQGSLKGGFPRKSLQKHLSCDEIADLLGSVTKDIALAYASLISSKLNTENHIGMYYWRVWPSVSRDYIFASLAVRQHFPYQQNNEVDQIQNALSVLTGDIAHATKGFAYSKSRHPNIVHGRLQFHVEMPPSNEFYSVVMWLPRSLKKSKQLTKITHHRRSEKQRLKGNFPGANQDPLSISRRYNIPLSLPIVGDTYTNTQAIAEFEGEQFFQSDLNLFAQAYNLSFTVSVGVVGPNNGGYFDEGVLDVEYIQGLAPNVLTYWIAKDTFDLLGMSEALLSITPVSQRPTVLSISWGSGESGNDSNQMKIDNAEFVKLGLAGVTVLSAAGDQGTGSTGFFSCGSFDPTWPATSPYVTTVGATYANSNANSSSTANLYEEISWSGSGGGFSNTFPMPSYQQKAVQSYLATQNGSMGLNNTMPPSQYFSVSGRAIPDVATLGTNFAVLANSFWGYETGTSASTPTFASLITRINHNRAAVGKKSLGFINPALYAFGENIGFDVMTGSNPCPPCTVGFNAAKGWDPISGWGTPNFTLLEEKLMSLP